MRIKLMSAILAAGFAVASFSLPAAAQKGKGILTGHGAGHPKTLVQIVLCLVHPPGTAKDSGLDVEFMNLNTQGYVHVSDFKGDGTYVETATPDNPVLLFSTTTGSLGGGKLSTPGLGPGAKITIKTAPHSGGHTGLASFPGGTFSWVCP